MGALTERCHNYGLDNSLWGFSPTFGTRGPVLTEEHTVVKAGRRYQRRRGGKVIARNGGRGGRGGGRGNGWSLTGSSNWVPSGVSGPVEQLVRRIIAKVSFGIWLWRGDGANSM